jgi:hypothetical protein
MQLAKPWILRTSSSDPLLEGFSNSARGLILWIEKVRSVYSKIRLFATLSWLLLDR